MGSLKVIGSASLIVLLGCAPEAQPEGTTEDELIEEFVDQLPNNFPIVNSHGFAASYSTDGIIDFTENFGTPQGTNGRHCVTCQRRAAA